MKYFKEQNPLEKINTIIDRTHQFIKVKRGVEAANKFRNAAGKAIGKISEYTDLAYIFNNATWKKGSSSD